MKKIILICLLALALILFASCRDKNGDAPANANNNGGSPGEINMENLYFFRSLGDAVKINPVSQTVSHVCIDPLCEHGWVCPVYGADHYVTGNYIFYKARGEERYISGTANQWESITEIRVYDMLTGAVRKLAEHWDYIRFIDATGSYIYYYTAEYDEEDMRNVNHVLYRADARTGNVIIITEEYPNIHRITDDKIYWYVFEGRGMSFYTTDLDGKNKTPTYGGSANGAFLYGSKFDGGYFYYTVTNNYMVFTSIEEFEEHRRQQSRLLSEYEQERIKRDFSLYRIYFDGGEPELLAESVMFYMPLGDKIYFTALEDEPELIERGDFQTWNWGGGKIWVMNSDGTDKRLLAETGYNLGDYGRAYTEAKTIDGVDYLAWSYNILAAQRYGDYTLLSSTDTIIINGSTGEWVVLPPPT
jgi:hypothetical protein